MGKMHQNIVNKKIKMNELISIIEGGGIYTTDYLMEKLNVTRRSIVKYVYDLKFVGFPIHGFTSSGGGLYLDIDKYRRMDTDSLKKKISV